jgi:F1F0 ATPase subunit 2
MFETYEMLFLVAAVFAGVLVGGFYFGGLWWTVNHMPHAAHPLKLYFGSLILRLAVVLIAFYGLLIFSGWPQLAASLVGFITARLVLIRRFGRPPSAEVAQREAV